jgi:DNA primase
MTFVIGPNMPSGAYLRRRGIDLAVANQLRATHLDRPSGLWDGLNHRFGLDRLRAAGLVSRSGRFLFARHELLFFYFDDGWPVYVQARDVTGTAGCKELSLAGLHSPVPYHVDLLRTGPPRVYLCEGCIDTLSALQMGLPAVGVPGVTGFQKEWFDVFRQVGHVVVLFDNDEAGRRQAAELRSQFRLRGIKADALHPEGVNDMNELLVNIKENQQ